MNLKLSSTLNTSRHSFPSLFVSNSTVKHAPINNNIKTPRNRTKSSVKSFTCVHEHNPEPITTTRTKLQLLVSEFKSLTEPIDRVKRLLDYAAVLPGLDESGLVQANKVAGCATQVWLEVVMDERGRMRFKADSDSEISKGFCSCLIMVLDGAEPEEVLGFKTEDLTEMNVGVGVSHVGIKAAASRVNTWQNVLLGMQKRTLCLVMKREGKVFAGCN